MARKLEEKLAAIHAIREAPAGSEALLRDAVRSKTGVLVAAAAKVIGAHQLRDLIDELAAGFVRLLERPIERDPGCRGKVAVARALHELDRWEEEVFARGIRHVQKEPVWGGSEDTAGELRGVCGLAYAHANHAEALDVLGELLADPERMARAAAAQALGDTGRPDATAVLRHKVLIGDDEPAVLVACFGSMLALARERSLPFVARFLDATDDRGEAAALALGESRLDDAFPLLAAWCERCLGETRARVGYLSLALLRSEPATAHLLEVVKGGAPADALAAIRALAMYRDDPAIAARVRAAAAEHRDRTVRAEAKDTFSEGG